MTLEINARSLRGKPASLLLAEFLELISAELKNGNDPSILLSMKSKKGEEIICEFRANSVPGEFQRVALKASFDDQGAAACFACGQQHRHLIGFPPQCPSCYGDNG